MSATTRTLAFVGSLTEPAPYVPQARGAGITVFEYDPHDGTLRQLSQTGGIVNPSFLSLHPRLPVLYATSEVYGWNEGTVTAYRIDIGSGRLTYLNKQPTLGSIAAHSSLDAAGRFLFVANYRMGEPDDLPGQSVAVFPVRDDGSLSPPCACVVHEGSGPVAERQEGPHPHCILVSPDGRHAVVADLGTDEVVVYRLDTSGALERISALEMRAGTGPRHLAWHPHGSVLYVNGELDQTVSALAWSDGSLRLLHTAPTLPAGFVGVNHTADLQVSPDGRFAYCSNRGHDSVAVFEILDGGSLQPHGQALTGGATPRSFCLDPAAAFLIAANQDSDSIGVLRRDGGSGRLAPPAVLQGVGTPMCVRLRAFDKTS